MLQDRAPSMRLVAVRIMPGSLRLCGPRLLLGACGPCVLPGAGSPRDRPRAARRRGHGRCGHACARGRLTRPSSMSMPYRLETACCSCVERQGAALWVLRSGRPGLLFGATARSLRSWSVLTGTGCVVALLGASVAPQRLSWSVRSAFDSGAPHGQVVWRSALSSTSWRPSGGGWLLCSVPGRPSPARFPWRCGRGRARRRSARGRVHTG